MFILLIMYFAYSGTFVLSKQNLLFSEPFFLTSSRMICASFIIFFYFAATRFSKLLLSKKIFKEIALVSFFGIFITNSLEFWGLKYLSPTRTCFLFCLTPFATCILSFFLLKEKISFLKGVGLTVGFFGAIIMIIQDMPKDSSYTISEK